MTDLPLPASQPAAVLAAEKPKRGSKWKIRTEAATDKCDPDDVASVRLCAKRLGTTEELIRAAVATASVPPPPPAALAEPVVTVAAKDGSSRYQLAGFEAALTSKASDKHEELLQWEDERLSALDVDVLDAARGFTCDDVREWVSWPGVPPARWAWRTKSNGLRFIFFEPDAAGVAALHAILAPWAADPRVKRIELLRRIHRPPPGHQIVTPPVGSYDWLKRLRGAGGCESVPQGDIDMWLEARGATFTPGGRLAHIYCPIAPEPYSGRDPVVMSDEGLLCFRCAGTRGRGFRSWSSLLDAPGGDASEPQPDGLLAMGEHYVHWEHARWVLRALLPAFEDRVLRPAYSKLLAVLHPEEPDRVAAAFASDLCFIRGTHHWIRTTDWKDHGSISHRSIGRLPSVAKSMPLADLALGTGPLPGYTPILPVAHAIDRPVIRGPWLLIPRPVPCAEPVGIPADFDALQTELLHIFQGASPTWVKAAVLLVAGAIQAQKGLPSPPLTLLTGPPGSGKGVAVALARGALGSPDGDVDMLATPDKIAEGIGNGLENGALIIFADEVGKAGGLWRESAPLLKLSDTHSWRKLHVGRCTAPFTAHLVLATSTSPRGTLTLPEFNRRLGWVDLPRIPFTASSTEATGELLSNFWADRIAKGIGVPSLARMRETPRGSALAAALIAAGKELLARFDGECWATLVRRYMGATAVEYADRPEDELLSTIVRGLYSCWLDEAVPLTEERYHGWIGCWADGPEQAAVNRPAKVLSLWLTGEEASDELHARLMRLETADVVETCRLQADLDIRLETRRHGRRVYVRFRGPWKDRRLFPPTDSRPA